MESERNRWRGEKEREGKNREREREGGRLKESKRMRYCWIERCKRDEKVYGDRRGGRERKRDEKIMENDNGKHWVGRRE